jgi:hypothetical protein
MTVRRGASLEASTAPAAAESIVAALVQLSLKTVVRREIPEDDPAEGQRVTDQLDRVWVKYTGNEPPYALRDPSMDERRVLFELEVVKVATFGRP